MARKLLGRAAEPAPYNKPRGVVASAQRLNLRDREDMADINNQANLAQAWQQAAWTAFDKVGEIKFAYGLVANLVSRLRLYPAYVVDPESPPVPLTDAASIERPEGEDAEETKHQTANGIDPRLAKEARDLWYKTISRTNMPTLQRMFALNIQVPGECYLTMINNSWHVKSTDELKIDSSGTPKLYRTKGGLPKELSKDTTIGRIWREHPRYSFEADSALRSILDDTDELILLSKVIRVNSRARLNAGMVVIDESVTIANRTETDDQEVEEDEESSLEEELYQSISATVADEDAANTVVPVFLRKPGGVEKAVEYISFERKIDEFLVQRADRTLERVLQGLDAPKDIVTGLANVKYSNAIQIDESLYKAHIEPLALVLCDAFTDIVLHPLLRAAGWQPEDIARLVTWYDPSEVVTRPDRAADAQDLYDRKELSGAALRKAKGFAETDRPSEEELAYRLAVEGAIPEGVMNILLQVALPKVLKRIAEAGGEGELPDSLSNALAGTEVPGEPELEPTVPA